MPIQEAVDGEILFSLSRKDRRKVGISFEQLEEMRMAVGKYLADNNAKCLDYLPARVNEAEPYFPREGVVEQTYHCKGTTVYMVFGEDANTRIAAVGNHETIMELKNILADAMGKDVTRIVAPIFLG